MFTCWSCRPTSALGALFRTFKTTKHVRKASSSHSDEYIRRFIEENTEIVGEQSLTPEIRLRLFTPKCRFWTERPELWPFCDPYWAIYWPGGQALSRSPIKMSCDNLISVLLWSRKYPIYHVDIFWTTPRNAEERLCWTWGADVEPRAL